VDSFDIFFEKREKNPLRKQELKELKTLSKQSVFKRELSKKLKQQKVQDTYKLLKLRNPESADRFLKQTEEKLRERILKPTVSKRNYIKFVIRGVDELSHQGIEINIKKDEKFLNTPSRIRVIDQLKVTVPEFLKKVYGILPLKRPKIVITDIKNENISYDPKDIVPAYYSRGVIYLDQHYTNRPDFLLHEYAHFIADLIPKQSYPILLKAYVDMLDEYHRRIKKKKTYRLQDSKREDYKLQREKIAKLMKWPSAYSVSNPDEFFAEIITNWKNVPNNVATYKFKNAVKQVITRL
jgi:hypothetical protein